MKRLDPAKTRAAFAALAKTATPESEVIADWLNHCSIDYIAYTHRLTPTEVNRMIDRCRCVPTVATKTQQRDAA